VIFASHEDVRGEFTTHLGTEVNRAIDGLTAAYGSYRGLEERVELTIRAAYVEAYLYTSLNSLLTSTHLLISGMAVPSGNLMRQYAEALSMGLLCCEPKLQVFEALQAAPKTYPVHKSIDRLANPKVLATLGLVPALGKELRGMARFFDKYSHPSQLGIASQLIFSNPGWLSLAGAFDIGKLDQYRTELGWRDAAGRLLERVADFCRERLPPKSTDEPPSAGVV
jgi:hypothetical protein